MAYARRTNSRRSGGYRAYSRPARRAAPRRGSSGRRSARTGARGQTLRIVVEQVPASPVSRPGMFTQLPQKPSRKAKL